MKTGTALRPDLHCKETLEFENKLRAPRSSGRMPGMDTRYGARHLKRALERQLVHPLANFLATEQIKTGDRLCIDWDTRVGRLVFWKEGAVPQLAVPWHTAIPSRHGDCRG